MPSRSKLKGNRGENRIVHVFNDAGFYARRVPLSGALVDTFPGDVLINGIVERELVGEVKSRKPSNVFWNQIKKYLGENDLLFLLEDRQEPLVVMPISQLLEILNEKDKPDLRSCEEGDEPPLPSGS